MSLLRAPSEGRWMLLAVVYSIVLAFVDGRLEAPGFPARYLLLFVLLSGYLFPQRPWRWAVMPVAALLAGDVLRLTGLAEQAWLLIHQVSWLGRAYDLLGQPAPYPASLYADLIAIAPAMAAAYLGQWLAEWRAARAGIADSESSVA